LDRQECTAFWCTDVPGVHMYTYGTSHGITVYNMVQMGQDRQEGVLSGVHMGSQCTSWYRWDGVGRCEGIALWCTHMGNPMGSQEAHSRENRRCNGTSHGINTTWYREDSACHCMGSLGFPKPMQWTVLGKAGHHCFLLYSSSVILSK